jgi:hypothetical protein
MLRSSREVGGVWGGNTRPNTPNFQFVCVTPIVKSGYARPGHFTFRLLRESCEYTFDNEDGPVMKLDLDEICRLLEQRFEKQVEIGEVRQLNGDKQGPEALKQFGYGNPLLVHYRMEAESGRLVFHRIGENAFGRERDSDRAAAVWLDFNTFNRLPRHVQAVDLVVHLKDGKLRSMLKADELLLVTRFQPGEPYAQDLARIREQGEHNTLDLQRAEALAAYLVEIHRLKRDEPRLWRRRLRDLIGNGEGIMGLTDSYPRDAAFVSPDELREVEEEANLWRWRLKPLSHRLSQVHGDFHPFNVLFDGEHEFYVLDRSRGEWGEPADDVSCMTINYLFFSLQRSEGLESPFLELHDRFWQRYLKLNPDEELTRVIQPWFAWRALVLASPLWYPTILDGARRKLLNFARRVMMAARYDFNNVNQYLEDLA